RIGWEVASRHRQPHNVLIEATFSSTSGLIKLSRGIDLRAGKLRESCDLELQDGGKLSGTEAEDRLFQELKYTYRDFATNVYQHQEAIRGILTQEAGD